MFTSSIAYLLTRSLASALLYSLLQGAAVYVFLYVLLKAVGGVSSRIKYYLSTSGFGTIFIWFANTWAHQYQKLSALGPQILLSNESAPLAGRSGRNILSNIQPVQPEWYSALFKGIEQHSSLVITVYVIGLALMLTRFIISIGQLQTLKNSGHRLTDTYWDRKLQYWQEQFSISKPVKLLLSAKVDAPVMLGYAKPIILLPIATFSQLSVEQVETILLHELAHIRRHDYLVNMLQIAGETVLFFNPFVWLISSTIREQREHCCDDMVIANTASPLPYANALAILETSRVNNTLSLAATGNKNVLFNRIKRIMEMKKTNTNYGQLSLILLAFLAITFSIAMINPTFAQKVKKTIIKTKDKDDASTNSNSTSYTYSYNSPDSVATGKTVKVIRRSGNDSSNFNINISIDDDDLSGAIAVASNGHTIIKKELRQMEKELSAIDWQGIKDEINKSLDEIDKELNSTKLKKDINIKISKHLEDAKEELEHAKKELSKKRIAISVSSDGNELTEDVHPDYESMLDEMTKDGLIDRSKKFKIKKDDDELYINGNRQPADVTARYKKYLDAKKMNISGSKGSLSISVEN